MRFSNFKNIAIYLLLLFSWFVLLLYFIIEHRHMLRTQDEFQLNGLAGNYRSAYRNFESQYGLFFENNINQPFIKQLVRNAQNNESGQDRLREILYSQLDNKFKNLQKIGFDNIAFTFNDGTVFLRMNNPAYYGDRIDKKRPLIKQVISSKQYKSGFEIGNVVAGFTFCHPLILNGEFVGVAFASISAKSFTREINLDFPGNFEFIISKQELDMTMLEDSKKKYPQSHLSDKFYMDTSFEPITHDHNFTTDLKRQLKNINLLDYNPQTIHTNISGFPEALSLIPIKMSNGKYGAYFVHYGDDKHYANMKNELIIKLVSISFLFIILISSFRAKHRLDKELEISESEYRMLFQQAAVGFCYVHKSGTFLKVNEKLCDTLGYTKEEMLQQSFTDVLHPDELKSAIESFNLLLLKKGQIHNGRYRLLKKDGSYLWTNVFARSFLAGIDNEKAVIATIEDISGKILAERLLDEQSKQMQNIVDGVPSMIFIKNNKHEWVFGSQAFCNFMGQSFDNLYGKSDFDFLPDKEATRIWADDDKVMNGETLPQYEEPVTNAKGDVRILMTSKTPFKLLDGSMGLLAIATDITEHHEARRTSAMLRKFFDNTAEGMIITDNSGIIKSVNRAFTRISGYEANEVIGKKPSLLQSGQHSKEFYTQMWQEILRNGRWEGEMLNKRKNGETYPEWLTITQILDDNGNIENFIAITIDMTQIHNDRKKLEEQDKMILSQSRFAAMGEMISMIAHQWRQPITAIGMGANNMLIDIELDNIDAEVFRTHLKSIGEQVQFLSQTIDDFRNFFKPQAKLQVLPLDTLVQSAVKIVGKSLESNGIKLIMGAVCNAPVKVHEGEFIQVLLVILGNAKDAFVENNVKNPEITIQCTPTDEDKFVELLINDNAGGIPETLIDKIFEPYFTTKSAKNGTGLGLYIAKTVIAKHQDGSIGVRSQNGETCFWIKLPIFEEGDINE